METCASNNERYRIPTNRSAESCLASGTSCDADSATDRHDTELRRSVSQGNLIGRLVSSASPAFLTADQ